MRSGLFAIIVAALVPLFLTGCAVYATPHHAGIYVKPLPVIVGPVVFGSGGGYQGHPRRGRHW